MTAPVEDDAEPVDWEWCYSILRHKSLRSADIAELTDREIFDQHLWADVDDQGRPKPRKRVPKMSSSVEEKAPQNDDEKYALLMKSGRELGVSDEQLNRSWNEYLAKKANANG